MYRSTQPNTTDAYQLTGIGLSPARFSSRCAGSELSNYEINSRPVDIMPLVVVSILPVFRWGRFTCYCGLNALGTQLLSFKYFTYNDVFIATSKVTTMISSQPANDVSFLA